MLPAAVNTLMENERQNLVRKQLMTKQLSHSMLNTLMFTIPVASNTLSQTNDRRQQSRPVAVNTLLEHSLVASVSLLSGIRGYIMLPWQGAS